MSANGYKKHLAYIGLGVLTSLPYLLAAGGFFLLLMAVVRYPDTVGIVAFVVAGLFMFYGIGRVKEIMKEEEEGDV